MTINSKLVALGCTAALFAGGAYALAPDPHERLEAFDLDRDGQFSSQELDRAMDSIFAELDTNRDGRLTSDEFRGHAGADADTDRDGAVTRTEFRSDVQAHLHTADANGDGRLSMAEIEAVHRAR